MATRSKTTQRNSAGSIVLAQWSGLLQSDDGDPVYFADYGDRSIQVSGTFGGASLIWEGSNNASSYIGLTDPQGNAIAMTVAGLKAVTECTRLARPRVSGGDGTTNLVVTVLLRKSEPSRRVTDDNSLIAV